MPVLDLFLTRRERTPPPRMEHPRRNTPRGSSIALVTVVGLLVTCTTAPWGVTNGSGIVHPEVRSDSGATQAAKESAGLSQDARSAPAGGEPWAVGQDWPTYDHDGQRTGANLNESVLAPGNVSELNLTWQYNTNGPVTSSVVLVNGTVYFGDWAGYLYAVNADNGSLEWKVSPPGGFSADECGSPGIVATPAVWNGTVYVAGGSPTFYAINLSTGSVEWSVDLGNFSGDPSPWTAHKIWSSALIYNGSAYVGVASGCDGPLVRGSLVQIDLADHQIAHVFYTVPPGQVGATIWSSPSVDPETNTIWTTTGNEGIPSQVYARAILALNASNVSELEGYAQEAVPGYDLDFGDGATLLRSSTGTPMVVAVNKNGVAYAFNDSDVVANGSSAPAWTLQLSNQWGSEFVPPTFSGSMLYFGVNSTVLPNGSAYLGGVWAVYPDNGTVAWATGLSGGVYAGVTYASGLVVVGENGGSSGNLVVLDSSTGAVLYNRETWKIYGEPIVVNGEVIFATGDIFANDNGSVEGLSLPLMVNAQLSPLTSSNYTLRFHDETTGGVPPYNSTWTFENGTTIDGAAVDVPFSVAGLDFVSLNVTDAVGHRFSQVIPFRTYDPLIVSPEASPQVANVEQSTDIGVDISGGLEPYSIAWAGLPPGISPRNSSTTDFNFTPREVGRYDISVQVVAASGQTQQAAFPLLIVDAETAFPVYRNPMLVFAPGNVSFSLPSDVVSDAVEFLWNFGDGSTASVASPVHQFEGAGTFQVSVTVVYPGGSVGDGNTSVTAVTSIEATSELISVNYSGCGNATLAGVALLAAGKGGQAPYTYTWSNETGSIGSTQLTGLVNLDLAPGQYTFAVSVGDSLGDFARSSVGVDIPPQECGSASAGPPNLLGPVGLLALVLAIGVVAAVAAFVLVRKDSLRGRSDRGKR